VLAVVLFLSAVAVGAMALLGTSALQVRHRITRQEAHQALDEEAGKVLGQLGRPAAPGVDAPSDPVWTYVAARRGEGREITLEDLSSRLNLNTVRTELLEKTELAGLVAQGHSPQELRQYRAANGPFPTLTSYAPFFSPDALQRDFTVYGYVNVNTAFEDTLRGFFSARTGDEPSAESFRGAIRGYLSRQELVRREELPALLGLYYPQLYPLMNVEPQMNVNFIPGEVLHAVLAYPYGGKPIEGFEAAYQAILAERAQGAVDERELAGLVHAKAEQLLVFQYLGSQTWFWRIRLKEAAHAVEWIVARLPGEPPVRFAILQDRFE
jgi:hypothetical protein